MYSSRRNTYLVSALLFALVTLIVVSSHARGSWETIPQSVGLGEIYTTGEHETSEKTAPPNRRPKPEKSKDVFPPGKPKAAGSQYSRTIVMARKMEEDVSWVDEELADVLGEGGPFSKAIYVVDDPHAQLRIPKNKGHEVMVYLTYIIDHYERLADVSIFLHAHRFAWHNNELFDQDSAAMLRYLSPERVTREGYMNLRCNWNPGCPDYLHPGTLTKDRNKQEEIMLAMYWPQLFPGESIPTAISQPCCAQFALSRDRIQANPKERYVYLRDWILNTPLSDFMSGRLFEYSWQVLFTGKPEHCPEMHVCYCDGYGFCFGGAEEFANWFSMWELQGEYEEELRRWKKQRVVIEEAKARGPVDEASNFVVPEFERDKFLKVQIDGIADELKFLSDEAFIRGGDPRARALEAGRKWKEGDGY